MCIIPDDKRREIEMAFETRLNILLTDLENIQASIRLAQKERLEALDQEEARILEEMYLSEKGVK